MRARGYTLLELVIVLIIVGIMAAVVAPVLLTAVTAYDATSDNVQIMTRMRYATERIAREVRETRREPAAAANYHVVTSPLSASDLEFYKGDGTRVRIRLVASTLELSYTTTGAPCAGTCTAALTDSVSAFSLNYCAINGTTCTATGGTVDKANLAFVELNLALANSNASQSNRVRIDLRTSQ